MDGDGQHSTSDLLTMIKYATDRGQTLFGERQDYSRRFASKIGMFLLNCIMRILGLRLDAGLSEFALISPSALQIIVNDSGFGIVPIPLLIQKNAIPIDRKKVNIRDRFGTTGKSESRHNSVDLFKKGLMYLYIAPWKILWAISIRIGVVLLSLFAYGIFIGIDTLVNHSNKGIASILLTIILGIGLISTLQVIILGYLISQFEKRIS